MQSSIYLRSLSQFAGLQLEKHAALAVVRVWLADVCVMKKSMQSSILFQFLGQCGGSPLEKHIT